MKHFKGAQTINVWEHLSYRDYSMLIPCLGFMRFLIQGEEGKSPHPTIVICRFSERLSAKEKFMTHHILISIQNTSG
jgi:hypothetical protein